MNLGKKKIVLDFDDTIVKSSEQIIRMLNQDFCLNKSMKDLHDWGYKSIYSKMTDKMVFEYYANNRFFENVEFNNGFKAFVFHFKDIYEFYICSKGDKENLQKKEKFCDEFFKSANADYKFFGLEFNNETGFHLDKSCIDFSDCLFVVDDNTNALLSYNIKTKILIKNNQEQSWNRTPINQDIYTINNFYDLIKMCEFDEKLRKEGILIG